MKAEFALIQSVFQNGVRSYFTYEAFSSNLDLLVSNAEKWIHEIEGDWEKIKVEDSGLEICARWENTSRKMNIGIDKFNYYWEIIHLKNSPINSFGSVEIL